MFTTLATLATKIVRKEKKISVQRGIFFWLGPQLCFNLMLLAMHFALKSLFIQFFHLQIPQKVSFHILRT